MLNNKNISDEELIRLLILEGNFRYFSVLTERYENYILEKCKTYVKDKELAADLRQEILIKIFLNLKGFKFESKFSTWLNSIINNICIDHIRKNKKILHVLVTEAITENFPEIIEDAEEESDKLSFEILKDMLDQLQPEEKLILLLKYNDQVSVKDIMRITNLNESAVKMRIKRAKDKINKLYSLRYKKK